MKILQIHNKVPYPPKDGGAIGIWNFTLEMARQGHDVTLFTMNTKKHYYDISQIPKEYTSLFRIISVDVDAPITVTGALMNFLFSNKPYNAQRFENQHVKNKLEELLSKEDFDVIQLEGLYVVPYIDIIRKYSKGLISFKAHNIEYEIWERVAKNETSVLKRFYLKNLSNRIRKVEQKAFNQPDVMVTVTERDAKRISNVGYKLPIHVAPAGIDLSNLNPDTTLTKYPSLFYIGALDWAPNQEGLLWFIRNVWKNISDKYPQIKLQVAGRNAPEWLQKNLSEVSNIEFLGEIDDAYQFMNQGSIMIVPLLSGSGMRVKIIEGMALGKTIITSSIGTEGINTTHNLDILLADTAEQFQSQVENALADINLTRKIGQNAMSFADMNFNITNIVKSLVKFWEQNVAKN